MSSKSILRMSLGAALVIVACAEGTKTTQPAKLAIIDAPHPTLIECNVSWSNPAGGLWTAAANWTPAVVPGPTDDVCITMPGTYTVTVRGAQTANTITIGAAGNNGVQTVNVQAFSLTSTLTGVTGITNAGVILLTWGGGNNGHAAVVAVTNGTLTNTGTIRSLSDAIGSPRVIAANLVNTGTVIIEHATTLSKANAVYENRGTFTINLNRSLTMAGNQGQTFRQAEGTLAVTGSFSINQETLEYNGGSITGSGTLLTSGNLRIGAGSVGEGFFTIRGASKLTGDIAAAQRVVIQGFGTGSTLTSATAFTNAGKIDMTWAGGTNGTASTLAVTEGTLTNEGTIQTFSDAIGSPRVIAASLLNTGSVIIGHATTFNKPNGVYENRGVFTINSGRSVSLANVAGQIFRQAEGTLTVTGSMVLSGQTFEVSGGTIVGLPVINDGLLRFAPGCTGSGDFSVRGASAKLEGDVPAGFAVRVNTNGGVTTTLTAAEGFTNAGTIELQPGGSGSNNGTAANLTVTNGTLTNSGTLRTLNDAFGGTGRIIAANLLNTGTIDIRTTTFFQKQNGKYVNENVILLGNRTLIINGLGQSFTTTGTITGGGTAGTLAFTGITLRASGDVAAQMNLTNVASHIGVDGPGTLNVTGNYRMITGGSLNVELLDPTPGTGHDRLNVTGTATLLGTLNVSVVGGACIDGGLSFEIMTYAARAGDFTTKNGLNLGGGRTLVTVPGTTNYKLNSAGPPCVAPDATAPVIAPTIVGTLGNNGWYVSNVTVTWSVTDDESEVTSKTGCDESQVLTDNAGVTFTCSATSAGGSSSESVTIKRDATAPTVSGSRSPAANANGWNNENVTATYTGTDGMSGIVGSGTATQLFSSEAAGQNGSHTFSDQAGNTATASVTGISIDKTAPTVTVSRSPAPNAQGWNNTDVTATYEATDALSGIDGDATFVQVFSQNGANQSGSHTFTDRAGNSATDTITGINIDKTPVAPQTGSASPGEIWSPNHKMVPVRVTMCPAAVSFTLRSVTNNETGAADIEGWAIGTADLEGNVRATRLGGGSGRTYTLVYDAVNASGFTFTCTVTVTVPHDQSKK